MCVCMGTWSSPTLCNPMDCSQPGSALHGIFQAGAAAAESLSRVRLSATLRAAARQAPLSTDSRQGYWSG